MSPSTRQSTDTGDDREACTEWLGETDVEYLLPRDSDGYARLDGSQRLWRERSAFQTLSTSIRHSNSVYRDYACSALLLLCSVGIFILSLISILTFLPKTAAPANGRLPGFEYTKSGVLLSCGSIFAEARAAGCIFDVITFAWTPPACYDTELAADVLSETSELAKSGGAGTFPYWRYDNFTEPLEQRAEVLSRHEIVWTDIHYHRAHCLYLWRVTNKAALRRAKGADGEVYMFDGAASWDHVVHCNKLLSMRIEENAKIKMMIGGCVKLG